MNLFMRAASIGSRAIIRVASATVITAISVILRAALPRENGHRMNNECAG